MAYVPRLERRRRIPLWAWGLAIGVPAVGIGAWYFLAKAGVVPPPTALAPAPTPAPAEYFDDFLGTELDPTKWNTYVDTGASYSVSDGFLHLSVTSNATDRFVIVYTKKTDWGIGKYRAKVIPKSEATTSIQLSIWKGTLPVPDDIAIIKIDSRAAYREIRANSRVGGTWTESPELVLASGITLNTPYILELEVTESNVIARAYDEAENLLGSATLSLPNFGSPPTFTVDLRTKTEEAEGVTSQADVDWIKAPSYGT